MGRGTVSVSETLMTPDTSAPLGIGSKHYSVSIPAYLHPVHRLLHPECVCVYPQVCPVCGTTVSQSFCREMLYNSTKLQSM